MQSLANITIHVANKKYECIIKTSKTKQLMKTAVLSLDISEK
jgi:hypothetical protein